MRLFLELSMSSPDIEQRHLFFPSFLSFCSAAAESHPFGLDWWAQMQAFSFLFPTFSFRFFLLLDRAAGFLAPRPRIGRTPSHPSRALTVRSTPANWMIAGAGDKIGLRVRFFCFSAFAWTDVAAGFAVLYAIQGRWPHHSPCWQTGRCVSNGR
jgi:hypothetical protein